MAMVGRSDGGAQRRSATWWCRLREMDVSDRQAAAMALLSGLALAALIVVWLTMITRTALLNQRLDELDARQVQLTEEINQTWIQIGQVTSVQVMEDRARRLGFKPAERVEYLVTIPEATPTATGVATE